MQLSIINLDSVLKSDIYLGDDFETTPEFLSHVERDRKDHLGFIAQEVNEVLPEIVEYDDSTDVYSMDYKKIIPVLVEAIKEQQEQISLLNAEISIPSKSQVSNRATDSGAEDAQDFGGAFSYLSEVQLYQNTPNPFTQGTEIRYYLPDQVRSAMIHIFDLNGIQVKSFLLDRNGNNSVIIDAGELKAGMYLYSLVADSHIISTKRMILTY